jgi:hypothetical protein
VRAVRQYSEKMDGHSPVAPVDLVKGSDRSLRHPSSSNAPRSSFLSVSLEIRDMIYEMLLTTRYCTDIDHKRMALSFRLHTAILLVNKQISAESTRVLRDGNHFIIVKFNTIDLHLSEIPTFRWLPEDKIANPLLRVVVDVVDERLRNSEQSHTCITTPNGLQSVISAIWDLPVENWLLNHGDELHHADLRISLAFHLEAPARYGFFSNLVLKPWEKVNGIQTLELSGDIQLPMSEHLRKHMLQGPFPDEVPEALEQYRFLAEDEYRRVDYNAAGWYWTTLCDYWSYLYFLEPYHQGRGKMALYGSELWQVLKVSLPVHIEGLLGLRKVELRQFNYQDPHNRPDTDPNWSDMNLEWILGLRTTTNWTDFDLQWRMLLAEFDYRCTSLILFKLDMLFVLKRTALGKPELCKQNLERGAEFLHFYHKHRESPMDLMKELKVAVNNVLIQNKSLWRCGRKWPLSTKRQSGRGWQVVKGGRTLWDWLDETEDGPKLSSGRSGFGGR